METLTKQNVDTWLNGNYDASDKELVKQMMQSDPEELEDAFYKSLEFGTGGLRGIMGVGTNRMNKYNVAMATQGLANYIVKSFAQRPLKAAVSHDSRNNSRQFAEITAKVLAANGFKVYLFEDLRPTPELSFAVRHFECQVGVMITASHNPKEYNGYKAYWNDGCQLVAPHDKNVIAEVQRIDSIDSIKMQGGEDNITIIGEETDNIYMNRVAQNCLLPQAIKRQHDLKIVYSPLHGTGITLVPKMLAKLGFTNVHLVESQAVPDGNFPTAPSPNPEEKSAMELAVNLAKEIDADIVMATDPDADRVGVAVKRPQGQWMLLNGNQTASILIYYLLKQWNETGKNTGKEYIVKTIVTSDILSDIAAKNKVKSYDVLTGFKYIGDKIRELEGKEHFIGGGEESYGYLIGDFVRDKDAVGACAMIAEIAAWGKEQGKTFFDILVDLYREYGFYKEDLLSITKKGKSGSEEIQRMMQQFRQCPPAEINGAAVVEVRDYLSSQAKNMLTGLVTPVLLPKSDVIQYFISDGSKITMRPSGTEPKIKFYFSVKGQLRNANEYDTAERELAQKIENIRRSLHL
ncbi:MAG: phospho-sugar mutase [Bacteroidales bacterium]|nr:phospho-sugar mutase [Bacteroidales bacterium]